MTLSNFLNRRTLYTLVAFPFILGSCSSSESEDKPNIIFIMTDDHTRQAISAYGSDLAETPNIDRIANEGMIFNNCYVSNSICSPSRAVLLTGKFSHLNGVTGNGMRFDSSQMTFPKVLQQSGYETAIVGKWHLKSQPTGFDYWNILPGHGHYINPDFIDNGQTKSHTGYISDVTTKLALNWLDSLRGGDEPFCLMIHHKAPHGPWMPAPRHLNMYKDEFPVPPNFYDQYGEDRKPARDQNLSILKTMRLGPHLKLYDKDEEGIITDDHWLEWMYSKLDPAQQAMYDSAFLAENREFLENPPVGDSLAYWKYQRYIQNYLRCAYSVDENIGRVLDYLEDKGLQENTVVIYTSDQGFFLGEHGWYDKRFMYEEVFSTPFVIKWPGKITAGSQNNDLAQNIDFAPTILDIAGAEIPSEIQGKSLKPLLEQKNEEWRDALYYHYSDYPNMHDVYPHYGIQTKKYKLIHFYSFDHWEFYDLQKDRRDDNNLISVPAYAEVIDSLKQELTLLREKYRDI